MVPRRRYPATQTKGRFISAAERAEQLLAELERPYKPGDNVACFRMRKGDVFVIGRSPRECEWLVRHYYPVAWPLFKHEHWHGGLMGGKWMSSRD